MIKITHKKLTALCDIAAALVPECRLMITEDGMNTAAVDTANVAMIQFRLSKEQFDEFKVEPEEIGMDVVKWKAAIAIMKGDEMAIGKKDGRIMITDGSYVYLLSPLDPTSIRKRPNIPRLAPMAGLEIDPEKYSEVISAMGKIGDKIRLSITGKSVELIVEGDNDQLRRIIEGDVPDGETPHKGTVSSLFSWNYLKDTAKAMKGAGKITMHLSQDHPVRFDFDLESIEATYLIAPRIEVESGEEATAE